MYQATQENSRYSIRTSSGFFDFSRDDNSVSLFDISQALSKNNRYVGHTNFLYSVGQHSLYVEKLMENDNQSVRLRLLGLIHDFHESVFGDFNSPLKWYLRDKYGIDLNTFCDKIDIQIYKSLEVEPPTDDEHAIVKHYDLLALHHEQQMLFTPNKNDSPRDIYDVTSLYQYMGLDWRQVAQDIVRKFIQLKGY